MKFVIEDKVQLDIWNRFISILKDVPKMKEQRTVVTINADKLLEEVIVRYQGLLDIECILPCEIEEGGMATLEKDRFVLFSATSKKMKVQVKDGQITFTHGRTKNRSLLMETMPFEMMSVPEMSKIEKLDMLTGFERATVAVGKGKLNQLSELCIVHTEETGKTLFFFCMDGHRACIVKLESVNPLPHDKSFGFHLNTHPQIIRMMKSSPEHAEVSWGEYGGSSYFSDGEITMRVPNVHNVTQRSSMFEQLTVGHKFAVVVERKPMLECIRSFRRARALSSKKEKNSIGIGGVLIEQSLHLTIKDESFDSENEMVTTHYFEHEPLTEAEEKSRCLFYVNLEYLRKAVDSLDADTIKIKFNCVNEAGTTVATVVLTAEDDETTKHVIAQMRPE